MLKPVLTAPLQGEAVHRGLTPDSHMPNCLSHSRPDNLFYPLYQSVPLTVLHRVIFLPHIFHGRVVGRGKTKTRSKYGLSGDAEEARFTLVLREVAHRFRSENDIRFYI